MIDYPLVNDELALLWMANMGCIDMNAWPSRADLPARPDWVIFDLDPSDDVGFARGDRGRAPREADPRPRWPRRAVRRRAARGGIHVLVPLARRHGIRRDASVRGDRRRGARPRASGARDDRVDEEQAPRGARRRQPERGLEGRRQRSTRCVRCPGAPVSTPLRWDEVRQGLDPAAFSLDEVRARVARHGDLFAPVLEAAPVARRCPAVARLGSAEEWQRWLEAADLDRKPRSPVLPFKAKVVMGHGHASRADLADPRLAVAELLGDPCGGAGCPRASRSSRRRRRGPRRSSSRRPLASRCRSHVPGTRPRATSPSRRVRASRKILAESPGSLQARPIRPDQ